MLQMLSRAPWGPQGKPRAAGGVQGGVRGRGLTPAEGLRGHSALSILWVLWMAGQSETFISDSKAAQYCGGAGGGRRRCQACGQPQPHTFSAWPGGTERFGGGGVGGREGGSSSLSLPKAPQAL